MKNFVFVIIAYLGLLISPVLGQGAGGQLPDVVDARVSSTVERARVILDLSATSEFAIAAIADPLQIAVDVRASSVKISGKTKPAGEGIVSAFKVELVEEGRVRTWLTLGGPAKVLEAYVLDPIDDMPARLVIDLVPADAAEFQAWAHQDLVNATARIFPDTFEESPLEVPIVAADVSKPLIVLDPGHGGVDSGAEAANGIKEKDIVLMFARQLQQALVDTGRFDVALTREGDTFVKLEDRVKLARLNQADLFISIHADYFQEEGARGASVYTRDDQATDAMDKVLADNENRVDIIAGFAVPQMEDRVVDILLDLMRREMRRQSYQAAQAIVSEMQPQVEMRRFPLRKANFMVLQAPDLPSILLELGFLSNDEDANNLVTSVWRNKVASALVDGVLAYFDGFAQR